MQEIHGRRRAARCLGRLALVLSVAGAVRAATNAPPAKPVDYRQMLARVRVRQQQADSLEAAQQAVRAFQMRYGRLPTDLHELEARGPQGPLPPPPTNLVYALDAQRGSVRLLPAGGRATLPAAGTNPPPAGLPTKP